MHFFISIWWCQNYVSALLCLTAAKFSILDCIWNVMAHTQKPDFVFQQNGRVNLNWRGRQFSRLLAAEVCASAVVMLQTPCSEAVWRVPATHSIRQFPLHFPYHESPRAITFQLDSTFPLTFYSLVVTLHTTRFNTKKNSTWCLCWVYVFCADLRKNDFPLYSIDRLVLYNWGGECLLHGTDWALI